MSSILSASSRIKYSTPEKSILLILRCEMRRPGVAIITSAPSVRPRFCCSHDAPSPPPDTATVEMGAKYEKPSNCKSICCANSRVGVIITALTLFCSLPVASKRLINGRIKAAVLPVPVCAQAMRSRPSIITGIVFSWMGVASRKFIASRPSIISYSNPNSSNVIDFIFTLQYKSCKFSVFYRYKQF